jgi:lipopolysaccharide assembly outer membrane protein LptD (OstA)
VVKDADGSHLVGNVEFRSSGVRVTADEADLTSGGREVVLRGEVRMALDPKTVTFVGDHQ